MKKYILVFLAITAFCQMGYSQWNVAVGAIDWTPNLNEYDCEGELTASFTLNTVGPGPIDPLTDPDGDPYPVCGVPLQLTLSISGGAIFNFTSDPADAITSEYKDLFSYSNFGDNTIILTQIAQLPSAAFGRQGVISAAVIAPSTPATQFVLNVQIQPPGQCPEDANTSNEDDEEETDAFTGSCLGPLPIELLTFTAKKSGANAVLDWTTAEEINFSHFEVERSVVGNEFELIGRVDAKGSNSSYAFTDRQPVHGVNYYRLKLIDLDGSFEFSELRVVNFEEDGRGIEIYPNPTADRVFIEHVPEGSDVSVFSLSGKVISRSFANNNVRHEISLEGNEAGIYLIRIENDGSINHHRIILID